MRTAHRLYAHLFGYFWAPCELCGEMRGGHEWRKGFALYVESEPGTGQFVCDEHGNDFTRLRDGRIIWGRTDVLVVSA